MPGEARTWTDLFLRAPRSHLALQTCVSALARMALRQSVGMGSGWAVMHCWVAWARPQLSHLLPDLSGWRRGICLPVACALLADVGGLLQGSDADLLLFTLCKSEQGLNDIVPCGCLVVATVEPVRVWEPRLEPMAH